MKPRGWYRTNPAQSSLLRICPIICFSSPLWPGGSESNWELSQTSPSFLEVMLPPKKIFQCVHGHLICEGCKNHPEIRSCPSCRVCIVTSQFTRNIPMERLIRSQVENTKWTCLLPSSPGRIVGPFDLDCLRKRSLQWRDTPHLFRIPPTAVTGQPPGQGLFTLGNDILDPTYNFDITDVKDGVRERRQGQGYAGSPVR